MDALLSVLMVAGMLVLTLRWLLAWSVTPLNRQAIRQLLLQRLISSGTPIQLTGEADEELHLQLGEQTCTVRLEQLYRRCLESPYLTGYFVRQAVVALEQALADMPGLPVDWRDTIVPCVCIPHLPAPEDAVLRQVLPSLHIGYVTGGEEALRWVRREDLAVSDVTEDDVHHFALRNLERSCSSLVIETPGTLTDGTDQLIRFNTNDGLDAARLLLPSFYQRFSPRFADDDLLVAIPTRDQLWIVAAHDRDQAEVLHWRARLEHARRAYPLTDQLYRVSSTGLSIWQPDQVEVEETVTD